jgi:hypothetical protein
VWTRDIDGLRLTFHLAGINNQNFLMRDDQTGTYWQQISGRAVSGPLQGRQLTLVHSDELTFALWRSEQPQGTVLRGVPQYASQYETRDWDVRMQRVPVVIEFPEQGMHSRDLILGIQAFGASRAFLYDAVIKEKLVLDRIGAEPVLLVVGPDNQSVRAFRARIPGVSESTDFYRLTNPKPGALIMDASSGSEWNFQGCAVSGPRQGACLSTVPMLKDYWFDWRNYNPKTTIWGKK